MRSRPVIVSLASVLLSGIAWSQQYQAVILQSPDTVQNLAQAISGGAGAGSFVTSNGLNDVQLALYWPDLTGSSVNLNPTGADHSYANALFGSQVGGSFNSTLTGGGDHAILWLDGTPDNFVDLHPAGFTGNMSSVTGMDAFTQVGYAEQSFSSFPFISFHPILWSGSAASAVDLQPSLPGVSHGIAAACAGGQQVGWVVFNDAFRPFNSARSHAFLWTGSAASALDLNPAAFQASAALGTDGTQQVGYAYDAAFLSHALLWTGSAESAVDLSPADSLGSRANACRNGMQVGYITDDTGKHAVVWSGSAESMIRLDDVSSSGFTDSVATGISADGTIVGYTNGGQYGSRAVMWVPVNTNHPPVAVAGPDQSVQAQGATTAVTLDGSASYDPDAGDSLTYQWTDESNAVVATTAKATLNLAMGSHTFSLTVTDNHGAASAPSLTHVTVLDTTPPVISGLNATPGAIEHDEHRCLVITVNYGLTDNADPAPKATLCVRSNERCDRDDAVVLDAHHVRVKAREWDERHGRIYTITVNASDMYGNKSSQSVQVTIVKPRRGHDHH